MNSPTTNSPADIGVADYFDTHSEEVASILIAKAPDVLILSRCIGAPKTARYFEERLGTKVTEKMIKTIKSKVTRGVLLVTQEELEKSAQSHPITAARMAREPSLCDPQDYKASITNEANIVTANKQAVKQLNQRPLKGKTSKDSIENPPPLSEKHRQDRSSEEFSKATAAGRTPECDSSSQTTFTQSADKTHKFDLLDRMKKDLIPE